MPPSSGLRLKPSEKCPGAIQRYPSNTISREKPANNGQRRSSQSNTCWRDSQTVRCRVIERQYNVLLELKFRVESNCPTVVLPSLTAAVHPIYARIWLRLTPNTMGRYTVTVGHVLVASILSRNEPGTNTFNSALRKPIGRRSNTMLSFCLLGPDKKNVADCMAMV